MSFPAKPYQLASDEKVTLGMVYTEESLIWGEVVTKEIIRLTTWLRTPMAPPNVSIYAAQMLYGYGTQNSPLHFSEIHVPIHHIFAIHVMPPQTDPIDYDETEPNRKMEPVTAMVGPFRFDGKLRMAVSSDLKKYLDVMKQTWTSMYDLEISQPLRPTLKGLRVPIALVRSEIALVAKV